MEMLACTCACACVRACVRACARAQCACVCAWCACARARQIRRHLWQCHTFTRRNREVLNGNAQRCPIVGRTRHCRTTSLGEGAQVGVLARAQHRAITAKTVRARGGGHTSKGDRRGSELKVGYCRNLDDGLGIKGSDCKGKPCTPIS